ncbi:sigma-70 family RNA polymerase sigma factor [Paenibacillus sp. J5C_2022]|uniref:sigma-70 family RNA polymerase sigma factor n=1 Tax=Paenibacillus sp. J5C2022 TaxID=2977129 RepID=UPI0021CFE994|nr:sigma-70 family RNA polymerase sigma factor [Paenibacillus sp. J5C2022]MCU6710491.1 sigma-70 family RNA polymerase sigma factor [Paenibacillus sp. J5C2022]
MVEDQELRLWLQRMTEGHPDAFREVYARIHLHVYRTVYFLVRNKHEVEDVVSEVYAALFQTLPAYDPAKPFKAWLNGIILRQTSSWKRRVWRRMKLGWRSRLLLPLAPSDRALPGEELFRDERRHELLEVVDRLSFKLREVIVLRYYHESSFEDIAVLLHIPVGTVKSRHHAAIRKLRYFMETDNKEKGASIHVQ